MGLRLRWSFRAQRDLDQLTVYIRAANPGAADAFKDALLVRVERLQEFPEMGPLVPEFQDLAVRQLVHRTCRIIYRVSASKMEIEIIRVWHAARGTPQLS